MSKTKQSTSPQRTTTSRKPTKEIPNPQEDGYGEIPPSATSRTMQRANTTRTRKDRRNDKSTSHQKKKSSSSSSTTERPSSNRSTRSHRSTTSHTSHRSSHQAGVGPRQEEIDQALALVLQQTYLERDAKLKKAKEDSQKDMELAQRLQRQDAEAEGVALAHDLELARQIEKEESEKILQVQAAEKRKQEEQDAAFARRMQREFEGNDATARTSTTGSTMSSLTNPGSSIHRNHRRRRGSVISTADGPLPRTHSVDEEVPIESPPQRRANNRTRRPSTTPGGPEVAQQEPNPSSRNHHNHNHHYSSNQLQHQPQRPTSSPAPKPVFPGVNRFFPKCVVCNQFALYYISTLGNNYHPECFKCYGCHKPIDQTKPFAYTTDDLGVKYPLHRPCYAQLYGITCVVCKEPIPTNENGRISYVKHPFFEEELMCPKHTMEKHRRRCTGCHRFEPNGGGFADLGDGDRCICPACCRTVIIDNEEAQPLYQKVLDFFEKELGLPIWDEMRSIPILIVGHDALNEQMHSVGGSSASGSHESASHIMTRGLCLSEHQCGQRFVLPRLRFDSTKGSFVSSIAGSSGESTITTASGYTFFEVPDAKKPSTRSNPNSTVTAILCLSGLPSDLTASILAHEATHAWIKLHPKFKVSKPIPMQVEEGCCQLSAMLYLTDGLNSDKTDDSSYSTEGPSNEKLRQYFKFSIETDRNEIYGE